MENIIVALISAGGAVLANQLILRRSLNAQELEHAKFMQQMEDRIKYLENKSEETDNVKEKLNSIEKSIIEIQKDIQYIKEKE